MIRHRQIGVALSWTLSFEKFGIARDLWTLTKVCRLAARDHAKIPVEIGEERKSENTEIEDGSY